MTPDTTFQTQVQRIAEIVEHLETGADPSARAMVKELLASLMALHGAGFERILQLVSETGEAGAVTLQKCGRDELVGSLLLLYGLHPEDLRTRVTRVLEKQRAYLEKHSASAELVTIGVDGSVMVRLHIKASGCGSSAASLKPMLEGAIRDAAPDAAEITVEEKGAGVGGAAFVSLAQLESGRGVASLSDARAAQRSGD